MEIVTILRELWRRRALVVVFGALAIVVAVLLAFRVPSFESRKYNVGVATARILVDTPNSQVVEVAPDGSDTLGVRATLIANLMAEGVIKAAIAKEAGIPPDKLVGVTEAAAGLATPSAPSGRKANVLTTHVPTTADGDRLPIIEIEAQAPDARRAAALATAAITGLRDYLDTKAAAEQVTEADRLRISSLGAPQAREVVRGPRLLLALGVALVVFIGGCAAILLFVEFARRWRDADAEESLVDDWRRENLVALVEGDDHAESAVVDEGDRSAADRAQA